LIRGNAEVSGRAMEPSHPGGGFCMFISSGRVDQNQAMGASIGTTRELTLVLHDEVKGLSQLIRAACIPEAYPTGMGQRKKSTSSSYTPDPGDPRLQPTRTLKQSKEVPGSHKYSTRTKSGSIGFIKSFHARIPANWKALSNSMSSLPSSRTNHFDELGPRGVEETRRAYDLAAPVSLSCLRSSSLYGNPLHDFPSHLVTSVLHRVPSSPDKCGGGFGPPPPNETTCRL
jgi:hypothetical protein